MLHSIFDKIEIRDLILDIFSLHFNSDIRYEITVFMSQIRSMKLYESTGICNAKSETPKVFKLTVRLLAKKC
jgi:hypothetical protein